MDGQWIAVVVLLSMLGAFLPGGMFLTTIYYLMGNTTTNEHLFFRIYYLAVRIPSREDNQNPALRTVIYPLTPQNRSDGQRHTFVILRTLERDNIWNTTRLGNLKSILGNSILDWFLPIQQSPCTRHDGMAEFALGPDFQRLSRDAGVQCP